MTFPYLHDSQFETGDNSEWTSETDGNAVLSIEHYSILARHGARLEIPYRGAYAAYINLTGADTTQYLEETGNFDTAQAGTIHIRFYFFAKGLTMAASDRFTIFALQSGAGTDEATVSVYNNAGVIELVMAETGATAIGASTRATDLIQNEWHCVELSCTIDSSGNDGTIDFFVDGNQIGAQLASLTQAAITQARLGAIGIDAGTTAGHLLFDQVVADDTRVYPHRNRFPATMMLTKSAHVAVGPGRALNVATVPGGAADTTATLYDTDEANTNAENGIIAQVGGAALIGEPLDRTLPYSQGQFWRGCYVSLSGTNPRAQVTFADRLDIGGIRAYANQRESHATV